MKFRVQIVALAFLIVLTGFLVLAQVNLPQANSSSLFKVTVVVTNSRLERLHDVTLIFLYVENRAPFTAVNMRGVREGLGDVLRIDSIDNEVFYNGVLGFSWTVKATSSVMFEPPMVTRSIEMTSGPGQFAGRLSPVVLPGEKVAVFYGGWAIGCEEDFAIGNIVWVFTIHATFQDSPVVLVGSGKFRVENSFPPCVGGLLAADTTGVPVVGATISLADSGGDTIGTATTDSGGFYFFDASTVGLQVGEQYTLEVEVSSLPAPYTSVEPSAITFTWEGSTVYFSQPEPQFWAQT